MQVCLKERLRPNIAGKLENIETFGQWCLVKSHKLIDQQDGV